MFISRLNIIKKYNYLFLKKFNKINAPKKILFNSRLKTTLYRQLKENLYPLLYMEDLNSMKYSIESRTPFLDRKLVEKVFSINASKFVDKGTNKNLLRTALKDILPTEVLRQKRKVGFNAEINSIKQFSKNFILNFIQTNHKIIGKILNIKKLKIFITILI